MLTRLRRRVADTTGVALQIAGFAAIAYGVAAVFGAGFGVIVGGLGLVLIGLLLDNARPSE